MKRTLLAVLSTVLLSAGVGTAAEAATYRCNGKKATIVGTAGADRIVGTKKRDVIVARGGADVIFSRSGNDLICAGDGGDVVDGGKGKDVLYGGQGKDACFGEASEHRQHLYCEAHRDPFNRPVAPPPAPRTSAARLLAAAPTATELPAVPARAGATSAGAGNYLGLTIPSCTNARTGRYIRFNSVFFRTYYTNPGYIALRPVSANYTNGWRYSSPEPFNVYQAPADGRTYVINPGTRDTHDRGVMWAWEAYWWNGQQWVDFGRYQYSSYNWVGYLGITSDMNAKVC
jgi:hypothetical protein